MFEFFVYIYNALLYKPMLGLLVFFYNQLPWHDLGLAIIILTLVIRFALYPLSVKAFKSQKVLQDLQPKIQELGQKYKNDREKLAMETLGLYKKEKINPFSGIFLALAQLPVLIALYNVFWQGLKAQEAAQLSPFFLGLIDLSKPNIYFAIFAGIFQFFQTKMMSSATQKNNPFQKTDMAQAMQAQMLYVFPVITIIILFNLPSALGLYWIVSGVFSIIQQYFILKIWTKKS